MKTKEEQKDLAKTYTEFKEFEGARYTGMKIGRRHKWHYDQGEWNEKKLTPDKWEISYAVKKRRAGKAPEGSGVPVGTEYHWLIIAHQNVRKLDANVYTTSMSGVKFKLAHKRADGEKWSSSTRAQRKRMITIMEKLLGNLSDDGEQQGGSQGGNSQAKTKKQIQKDGRPKKENSRRTLAVRRYTRHHRSAGQNRNARTARTDGTRVRSKF